MSEVRWRQWTSPISDPDFVDPIIDFQLRGDCCQCGEPLVNSIPVLGKVMGQAWLQKIERTHDDHDVWGPPNRLRRGKSWSRTERRDPTDRFAGDPFMTEIDNPHFYVYCKCGKGQWVNTLEHPTDPATVLPLLR